MGSFDAGTDVNYYHDKVNPKASGQDARAYLSELLAGLGDFDAPNRLVAGMSENEQAGQSALADIMAGKSFQDPTTSPMYAPMREQSLADEERAVSKLRGRQSAGGMYNSSRALNEEGQMRSQYGNDRATTLGKMYESERSRDNEYTRVQAANQFGSLPRNLEQQKLDNDYEEAIMELLFPYQTGASIAQGIIGNEMWTGPTVTQTASDFSNLGAVMNMSSQVAGSFFGMGGVGSALGGVPSTGPSGGPTMANAGFSGGSLPTSSSLPANLDQNAYMNSWTG